RPRPRPPDSAAEAPLPGPGLAGGPRPLLPLPPRAPRGPTPDGVDVARRRHRTEAHPVAAPGEPPPPATAPDALAHPRLGDRVGGRSPGPAVRPGPGALS